MVCIGDWALYLVFQNFPFPSQQWTNKKINPKPVKIYIYLKLNEVKCYFLPIGLAVPVILVCGKGCVTCFLLGEFYAPLNQWNGLVNGLMSNVLGVREEWECIARAGPHKPTVSLI